MADCHLLRPEWLWLLLPFALIMGLQWHRRQQTGHWGTICDPQLLPYILQGREGRPARWPMALIGLTGFLGIIALSGPTCERREQPIFRAQSALVIALDLSRSMDATDIKPSRLTRARLKLIDMLKRRQEGQTALIVYAGQAFTVSPLTDDAYTIIALISSLDTGMMPVQGSHPAEAVHRAAQLLQQAGIPSGDILLITDGIADADIDATQAAISATPHRVSILAVGTPEGAPIHLDAGGFLKNQQGAIVFPKLNPQVLRQLAHSGKGRYHALTSDNQDINAVLHHTPAGQMEIKTAVQGLKNDQWYEAGPWLLLLVAPLAALAFRRGYLLVLFLMLLPLPRTSQAMSWTSLWYNKDQLGAQQLAQGHAEQAAKQFRSPEWKAAAQYRAGQYQQAARTLQAIHTPDARYNEGNALARMGHYPAAIKAYEQALALKKDNPDARYNRDLVKKLMEKQGQSDPKTQNQDSAGKGDKDKGKDNGHRKGSKQHSSQKDGTDQARQKPPVDQHHARPSKADQAKRTAKADSQKAKQEPSAQKTRSDRHDATPSEADIATEQWLRRIPDDPGGLMRRKFKYQYQDLAKQQKSQEKNPW